MKRTIDNDYTTRSGVLTAISDKISINLDKYGQYEYEVDGKLLANEIDSIQTLDSLALADEGEISGKLYGKIEDIKNDSILGWYSDLYCGYVSEGDYRKNGTSGGFTTWLLVQLLEKGLIDGVVCVGKSDRDGILYEYKIVKTAEQIRAHSKSRYYPMELSKVLEFIKENEGRYAIVGIPSFISDIRRLQQLDEIFADRIKYTLGLLCGHQKTTKYGEAIAFQAGIKPKDVESIDFRFKIENGIASDYVSEVIGFKEGERVRVVRKPSDTYVNDWGAGMFKVNFSDYVDDCFGETADVTFGDAWLPQYVIDGKGTSVVIVRNKEIAEIIKIAMQEDRVRVDIVDAKTVKSSQKGMIRQYRGGLPYRLSITKKQGIAKRVKPSRDISLTRKIVQNLRLEITKKSKLYFNEAVERDDWLYFENKMNPLLRQYRYIYKIMRIRSLGFVGSMKEIFGRIRNKI